MNEINQEMLEDLFNKREKAKIENRERNDKMIKTLLKIQIHCEACKFMSTRLNQASLIGPQSTEKFCHVNDTSCVEAIRECFRLNKASLNKKLKKIKNG